MRDLTRSDLERGRALLKAAFREPWRYQQFEIECGACRAYENGTEGDGVPPCTNAECSSNEGDGDVPCTFVEAPEAYPGESGEYSAQVVCTIEVPGLSCLAQQNGEAICWLRNNAEALFAAHEQLADFAEVLVWLSTVSGPTYSIMTSAEAIAKTIAYAESLGWRRQ